MSIRVSAYYVFWGDGSIDHELVHCAKNEEKMLAFVNERAAKYPNAVFEIYYGYKVPLRAKTVVTAYDVVD